MVSKVDTAAVCGHFNSQLSGIVPNSGITKAVGQLVNQTGPNFVESAKQIGLIFHNAILGNFLVPHEQVPCFPFKVEAVYRDWDGNPVFGNLYKADWINNCLSQPLCDSTIKLWSGFTNLKSAGVIDDLSRSEKSEVRGRITHETTVNRHTRREWKQFLAKFIPRMIDELCLDSKRQYDVLRHMPLENKGSRFLNLKGEIQPCQRGAAEFADLSLAVRHPVVNRLFRQYTQEATSALILGTDDYVEELELSDFFPSPFLDEKDLGSVAIAWKDADKPRIVFILVGALDSLSRPMFHKLEEIESRWNIQAVFEQDSARKAIQRFLSKNSKKKRPKTVCSYDQSAFTDNFSYKDIQRPVVEELVRNGILTSFDLAVLDELCLGSWNAEKIGLKYQSITFGTGTAMGTPPSFPLASIANGLMVAYAYWKAYGEFPSCTSSNPPGRVVGDDCIIFDENVAKHYESFCGAIGLVINKDKSVTHKHVAEFCGKYITRDGIYSKKKLIYPSCLDSVKNFAEYYSDKVDDYFRAYPQLEGTDFIEILRLIERIPQPYGLGGSIDKLCLETATDSELLLYLAHSASKAEDYLPVDLKGSRQDIKEAIRRNDALPNWFKDLPHVLEPEPEREPKRKDPLVISLARDVRESVMQIPTSASWDELYQLSKEIATKLAAIDKLDPPQLSTESRPPTLLPKKGTRKSSLEILIDIRRERRDKAANDPDIWMGLDS